MDLTLFCFDLSTTENSRCLTDLLILIHAGLFRAPIIQSAASVRCTLYCFGTSWYIMAGTPYQ